MSQQTQPNYLLALLPLTHLHRGASAGLMLKHAWHKIPLTKLHKRISNMHRNTMQKNAQEWTYLLSEPWKFRHTRLIAGTLQILRLTATAPDTKFSCRAAQLQQNSNGNSSFLSAATMKTQSRWISRVLGKGIGGVNGYKVRWRVVRYGLCLTWIAFIVDVDHFHGWRGFANTPWLLYRKFI